MVAAAENDTLPAPLPLAPEVIVNQGALLVAVHAQPLEDAMLTAAVPPPAGRLCESGETEKLQPGDCVTVKICPAIVAVPVRVGPSVAATVMVALPLPVPVAGDTVIQGALLAAVHGQPEAVVIAIVVVPPAAPAP